MLSSIVAAVFVLRTTLLLFIHPHTCFQARISSNFSRTSTTSYGEYIPSESEFSIDFFLRSKSTQNYTMENQSSAVVWRNVSLLKDLPLTQHRQHLAYTCAARLWCAEDIFGFLSSNTLMLGNHWKLRELFNDAVSPVGRCRLKFILYWEFERIFKFLHISKFYILCASMLFMSYLLYTFQSSYARTINGDVSQ